MKDFFNDFLLKVACFITGRNYLIVKECSEASRKSVWKFLGAILLVSIVWGFIGFQFAQRYLKASVLTSLIIACVLVFMVIQIERQIILSVGKNLWSLIFRGLIGIVMAVIGSVIIDQILFQEDIEKKKVSLIQEEVNEILPKKTREIASQIVAMDSSIALKEKERTQTIREVDAQPFIKSKTSETKVIRGSEETEPLRESRSILTDIPNPKANLIPALDDQIKRLREQKGALEAKLFGVREEIETDLKSKTGFLDELIVLFSILLSHWVAGLVWLAIWLFFFAIEMFVLVNKWTDERDDYDDVVAHQLNMHKRRLKLLSKESKTEEIELRES